MLLLLMTTRTTRSSMPTSTLSVTRMMIPGVVLLLAFFLVGAANAHAWGPPGDQFPGRGSIDSDSINNEWGPPNKGTSSLTIPSPTSPPSSDNTGNSNNNNNNNNNNDGDDDDDDDDDGDDDGGTGSSSNSNSGGGYGLGSGSGSPAFDYQSAEYFREIHGILAAVAIVGLFPLGAVLVRVVPGRFAWLVHALTQVVGYITFVAAAVLGLYLVSLVKIGGGRNGSGSGSGSLLTNPQTNAHPIIGILILILLSFQPALGLIHHSRFKRQQQQQQQPQEVPPHRTVWSHAHIWIGRIAITLGIINGGLGLGLAGASVPSVAAYAVVSAVVWLLWFLVAVWGEVRLRRDRREQNLGGRLRGGGEEPIKEVAMGMGMRRHTGVDADASSVVGDASTVVGGAPTTTTMTTMTTMTTGGSSSISNSDRHMMAPGAVSAAATGTGIGTAHRTTALVPPIFPPERPETPSPPYSPGPVGSSEWTVYGGPGLNNTPRPPVVSPVSPIESEKGHYGRDS